MNITASNITYTVLANDTIATVAAHYGVGECDLARLNLLSDPSFIYAGEVLRIPSRATFPDDYSCFSANNTHTKNACIYGGPHVYIIQPGDTIQKIANEHFGITVESIMSYGAQTEYITQRHLGPYDSLQTGETVRIPVCENTTCTITDFTLTFGTLQDFATEYKVTVGQIMGLNPGYNHSEAIAQLGVLYDCTVLS